MAFNNLPGVQVSTIDGGLVTRRVPTSKSVLILGTAAQGPANEPFAVTDRAIAAEVFGFSGSLVRASEEVALGGADNIVLFRIGTTAAVLKGVGLDNSTSTPSVGFNITFGQVDANVGSEYKIWYAAGVLYVWNGTQLVYANDVGNDTVVDTGDISLSASPALSVGGLAIGTGAASLADALTVNAAAALTGGANTPVPTLTAAVLGTAMTGRELYIALAKAMDLLDIYPIDSIIAPDATLDNPNVAFHTNSDTVNNPATNANALDWLKVTTDTVGNRVYQWAADSVDSNGVTATPMSASTAATRLAAGFGEVNFAHLLATFAHKQEQVGQAGTCLVFLGTSQPTTFKLVDLRTWVGFLPTYDQTVLDQIGNADIKVVTDGSGLLANPYLAGCTSARLNSMAIDHATGRSAGIFLSGDYYDGSVQTDKNNNPIDIGAYIHVVADVGVLANGFKNGYAANLSSYGSGYASVLDEKQGLTNHPVKAAQLWKPNSVQLDSATQIGINFLRFKGTGNLPVWTHDQTASTAASDYKNLLRQRIKGLVVSTLRAVADPFVGTSSIDGLQLQSLQTALTNQLMVLQKRGYVSRFNFTVTTTPAEQRIGHATIDVTFNPADELVQLNASVAVSRN